MSYDTIVSVSRICDGCQHSNAAHALTCKQCGRILLQTTRPVTDSVPDMLPAHFMADNRRGTVTLYIQGRNLPVKIDTLSHLVLGRRESKDDTFVTIDLSSAEAHRLGVSRRHALISLHGARVIVEDLGSSNGTYINDTRLEPGQPHPLLSGDKLRLGKLVILFVYHFPEG